jgi:Protein of unknown function (DUF2786)
VAMKPATADRAPSSIQDAERLQSLITSLCVEAMGIVPKPKVGETVRQWLARSNIDPDDQDSPGTITQALMLALELAIFTPSLSGSTAVDRFARQRKSSTKEERGAIEALMQASFRLLRIRSYERDGLFSVEDLATGEILPVLDRDLPATITGLALAARLCPLPGGIFVIVGPPTPLDDAALEIAMGFVRPGKGLANQQRCAAAIYRHVVRHGGPRILGLNQFPGIEDDPLLFDPEESELDFLAQEWAELPSAAEPAPESMNKARSLTSVECLLEALVSSVAARRAGNGARANAYSRLASVQIETMQRRAAASLGGERMPLDRVATAIDRGIAEHKLPNEVRFLFYDLRRLILAAMGAGANGSNDDLARVIQRIQALRAKTIEQGCTEEEALASANKVAELLDRYGLSLSEIEFRRQTCEGIGIDTDRRRRGALDACVPSIALFCDCKVWGEKTATRALRYVFFGFPADVEAAHFLYNLIDCPSSEFLRHGAV